MPPTGFVSGTAACAGAFMASLASRDGTTAEAVAKVFTSSLPRADQRPCSTQNDAIWMRPDFGGSIRLTLSTRSCWPPFTIEPDWTKTSSVPRLSICSSFALPVETLGTDEVFVQSGSIVKGGQQDRVLSVS